MSELKLLNLKKNDMGCQLYKGIVTDKYSKKGIANVFVRLNSDVVATTNNDGEFSFFCQTGVSELIFESQGYHSLIKKNIKVGSCVDVKLSPNETPLFVKKRLVVPTAIIVVLLVSCIAYLIIPERPEESPLDAPAATFDSIGECHDGYCVVVKGNKYGVISANDSILVVDTIYSYITEYYDSVAWAKTDSTWLCLHKDSAHNYPISSNYSICYGLRKFSFRYPYEYNQNGQNRKIDSSDMRFKDSIKQSPKKTLQVSNQCGYKERFGYANSQDEVVIPPIYDSADDFLDGIALVRSGDKSGCIRNDGSSLLNIEYEELFRELGIKDFIRVKKDGQYGVYSISKNKVILPIEYEWIGTFTEGYAIVQKGNGGYSFIDEYCKLIGTKNFDSVKPFNGGYAAVKKGKTWGFINTKGGYVIESIYTNVESFSEGVAVVQDNGGLFHYINTEGKSVSVNQGNNAEETFVSATSIKKGYGIVSQLSAKGERFGIVSKEKENVVIRFKCCLTKKPKESDFFECGGEKFICVKLEDGFKIVKNTLDWSSKEKSYFPKVEFSDNTSYDTIEIKSRGLVFLKKNGKFNIGSLKSGKSLLERPYKFVSIDDSKISYGNKENDKKIFNIKSSDIF